MICWTTWISYCLYSSVVLQKASPSRCLMHSVTWNLCSILSILPLLTRSYGNSGPWCWIRDGTHGAILRFVCFYIPLWLGFAINVYFYLSVSRTLRRYAAMSQSEHGETRKGQPSTRQRDRLIKMADHLQWYPLIFVISWVVNTVIRVIQAIYPSTSSSYTLALIHVICDGTFYQSMGNVFAYGFNGPVKREWSGLWVTIRQHRSLRPLFFIEQTTRGDTADDFARISDQNSTTEFTRASDQNAI
jgi:hypothetical protein